MNWVEKYRDFDSPRKRVSYFRSHVVNLHRESWAFSGGIDPAILAEIEESFKHGNFVACVLLCQLVVEHSLAHSFVLTEQEAIATKGFAKLIAAAAEHSVIDSDLADQLTSLRKMRNPYVHPKFGEGSGTYIRRVLDTKMDYNELPVADGIEAIRILGNFINQR
ncbi:hypothetical protein GCM10007391_21480 [Alteromonas halophila]|uniref:Uncharacterized protein n=1 Tax=Alteromonas halophila TaxID=516698 RepID=A0A918JKZ1_9ALTE|nr:hypothetical protein GCM10007391_21480 [Alteromonas halophila]